MKLLLVGAPQVSKITDHKPLYPIFNSNRQGSIRTDRIKLCYQDINYTVQYQQGKANQSDYLTGHGKPQSSLAEEEQKETDDLHNLLYLLHATPIINHLSISSIATYTKEDQTLAELFKIVKSGKRLIPKFSSTKLKKFQPILSEITMTGNTILLKSNRIILPEKLQQKAIELAHKGSHP